MSITVDHEGDEIVLRILRGKEAGGFARFLEAAADAFEHGKLQPSNRTHQGNIPKAADTVRAIATKIHGRNSE